MLHKNSKHSNELLFQLVPDGNLAVRKVEIRELEEQTLLTLIKSLHREKRMSMKLQVIIKDNDDICG